MSTKHQNKLQMYVKIYNTNVSFSSISGITAIVSKHQAARKPCSNPYAVRSNIWTKSRLKVMGMVCK